MPKKNTVSGGSLLIDTLNNPQLTRTFLPSDWSLLLRMAKASKLIAHLGWVFEQQQLTETVPEKIRNHCQSAQAIIAYRQRMALWEINRLQRALAKCNTPLVILKGCAYLLTDIPFAKARIFSDVDLMVNKSAIETVENTLLYQDWQSMKLNDYDQNYYREWMHEIPPLCHASRNMEVDIHHTIIPPTSDLQPDPALLMRDATDLRDSPFKVLSPCDMVLHSAVHLFFDSDLSNKLRDLVDLDQLFRHFCAQDPNFLEALLRRASILGLQRPLYYSLRYSHQLLNTPIPTDILQRSQIFAPPTLIGKLMDVLIPTALLPEHPDASSLTVAFARWLLFVRSHYLRMPLKLLIPHLARKSLMRFTHAEKSS